jgi:hypothetical protein
LRPSADDQDECDFMSDPVPAKSVERLFPFVLRSRALILGRDVLIRSKTRLHFVLITTDLSENSRAEILRDYSHYPIVQHYTSADLEKHFQIKGAKVVGFQKSGLAQSIYAELKEHRINKPVSGSQQAGSTEGNEGNKEGREHQKGPNSKKPRSMSGARRLRRLDARNSSDGE